MTQARLAALEWERGKIGVHEQPLGSNRGPLIDQWNRAANGLVGEPWCMSFQHAAFAQAGVTLGGWAGVENFLRWGQAHGYEVTRPFRGDLVCWDWEGNRWYDHVGIVDRVLSVGPGQRPPYLLRTIEGNTEPGVVAIRKRIGFTPRFIRVPGVVRPLA